MGRGVSSPATVIQDGLDDSGSASATPASPPPRYGKKIEQTEVWYAKWWMCGFADAFNPMG